MDNRKIEGVKPLPRALVLSLLLVPVFVLSAVRAVSLKTGVSVYKFMRDPTMLMGANPLLGVVSDLGVLLWCASATICLFGWSILRHRLPMVRFSKFLLYSGLLTTFLLVDDFFLIHDYILPKYFSIPTDFLFVCYGILTLSLILTFQQCILRTEYRIAFLALCFFGVSLIVDIFQPSIEQRIGDWRILIEDGFKFSGIAVWFSYFFRSCFVAISGTNESTS